MSTHTPSGYPVSVNVDYTEDANRLTTFFRLLLAIPHFIILYVYGIVAGVVMLVLWLTIVVTGKRNQGMANFLTGYLRWQTRVNGYVYLLTDEYPPFEAEE